MWRSSNGTATVDRSSLERNENDSQGETHTRPMESQKYLKGDLIGSCCTLVGCNQPWKVSFIPVKEFIVRYKHEKHRNILKGLRRWRA